MPRIPEETIQSILDNTDIVDVISGYIPLKRAGGTFKACCPFHNEKTPSFNVNPQRQFYYCFGCGASGSAITFVKDYENLPFVDAVKKLADRAGVTIQEEAYDPKAEQRKRIKSRLVQLHNASAKYFHTLVRKAPEAQIARDYLKKRGMNVEAAERWLIGWMPENPQQFLHWAKEHGFNGRELVQSGICNLKDANNPKAGIYVNWRNRLLFPIHNDYGDIIGYSARQLIDDPNTGKYINTRETQLFDKSRIFFGLDKARRPISQAKFALLCEGQIDVIALHEKGVQNAIAALGTGTTEHHARLLKRYTQSAILCYDADNAGYKAATRAFRVLAAEGIHVRCVTMPAGEDPDSYIQQYGVEAFQQLLENALEFFEYKLQHAANTSNLNDFQEKANLVVELAELANLITNKVAQDMVVAKVAARLTLSEADFRDQLINTGKKMRHDERRAQQRQNRFEPEQTPPTLEPLEMDSTVSYLCFLALSSEKAQSWLCEQIESLHTALQGFSGGALFNTILSQKPSPSQPSAVQSFLQSLPDDERSALQRTLSETTPSDPIKAAEETTNMLLSKHFQQREAVIRTAMKQSNLPPEELMALLQEAQEIQELLKNLSQRFIR
ncbi:DNA primase [Rubritalea marina]|uniref:DNA primase n=1 Tax=Rubritalea marina TaxID=361055 RepID=UPI00036CB14C|nr:DNA primase [Rubritalea marina]